MFCVLKKSILLIFQNITHNSNREKQVILLLIRNGEGWYYPAIKNLSALLRGIKSKHHGDILLSDLLSFFCNRKISVNLIKKFEKLSIFVFC